MKKPTQRPVPRKRNPPLEPAKPAPYYERFAPQRTQSPTEAEPFNTPLNKPARLVKPAQAQPQGPAAWRLNRYIANSGLCSRRQADEIIRQGRVQLNGVLANQVGAKVDRFKDQVRVDGKLIKPEKLVYLLLNKPKNHVTTSRDPEGRRTVMDIIRGATQERVYPVGRLDRNTTGLLLLTNDGELAKRLTHPSHKVRKLYAVRVDKELTPAHLEQLRKGVELEDGLAKADEADYIEGADADQVGIEIHSGKNRVVRRMLEALGYEVKALDRVAFGPLTKKGVPRGHYRMLTEREVGFLKML